MKAHTPELALAFNHSPVFKDLRFKMNSNWVSKNITPETGYSFNYPQPVKGILLSFMIKKSGWMGANTPELVFVLNHSLILFKSFSIFNKFKNVS